MFVQDDYAQKAGLAPAPLSISDELKNEVSLIAFYYNMTIGFHGTKAVLFLLLRTFFFLLFNCCVIACHLFLVKSKLQKQEILHVKEEILSSSH